MSQHAMLARLEPLALSLHFLSSVRALLPLLCPWLRRCHSRRIRVRPALYILELIVSDITAPVSAVPSAVNASSLDSDTASRSADISFIYMNSLLGKLLLRLSGFLVVCTLCHLPDHAGGVRSAASRPCCFCSYRVCTSSRCTSVALP